MRLAGSRSALAALALAGALGCAAEEPEGRVQLSLTLPERVACAAPPGNILAEAWVSGMNESYDLQVSSTGEVTGTLEGITARIDRRITLDYFIMDPSAPGGVPTPYRLLLAEAYKEVQLTEPDQQQIEVVFTDSDFVNPDDCLDMTNYNEETGVSANTVDDFVEGASPCDVDDDGSSNLEELCASPTSTDPYDPLDF